MPKATLRRSTTPTHRAWEDPTFHEALDEGEEDESPESPTTVYYLHTVDHELLYIGITSRHLYMTRFGQHAHDKLWWDEVAYASFEHLPTRIDAIAREKAAIRRMNPRYNVVHSVRAPEYDNRRLGSAGCSVEDCHRKHKARGLCEAHYVAKRRRDAAA